MNNIGEEIVKKELKWDDFDVSDEVLMELNDESDYLPSLELDKELEEIFGKRKNDIYLNEIVFSNKR